MKFNNLQALEKHLQAAAPTHFVPVYFILGKDRFLRQLALEKAATALLAKQKNPELCLKSFNEDHFDINAVLEELNTLSIFSPLKVISVDLGDKTSAAILKPLQEYCMHPQPNTFLLLSAGNVSKESNVYKQIEKIGVIVEFVEEKEWEKEKSLPSWIVQQVAEKGKAIDPLAAQLLVKQLGTDLAILQNELNKLLCYVDDRHQITVQDVGAICTSFNVETSWQLGDALFRRDAASALRIMKALLNEGNAFLTLLRHIRHQFQTEFIVASIIATGGSNADITQRFPYMKGTLLDKHLRLSKGYGLNNFQKAMQEIDDFEVMSKNSVADTDLLADLLITKLT